MGCGGQQSCCWTAVPARFPPLPHRSLNERQNCLFFFPLSLGARVCVCVGLAERVAQIAWRRARPDWRTRATELEGFWILDFGFWDAGQRTARACDFGGTTQRRNATQRISAVVCGGRDLSLRPTPNITIHDNGARANIPRLCGTVRVPASASARLLFPFTHILYRDWQDPLLGKVLGRQVGIPVRWASTLGCCDGVLMTLCGGWDRHVILPKPLLKLIPKSYFDPEEPGVLRILSDSEWRGIGITQSIGWEHYEVHGTYPPCLLHWCGN